MFDYRETKPVNKPHQVSNKQKKKSMFIKLVPS